ncbi:unnamed protein product [Trichogramma brassicae]|uniref:Cytochrome P450 n=1 Tax=Trichogramma brassicae TaxID=86971 RepID=A0A6H5IHB2_9HYME|nr:unnamed protein product [Trichogramma brassicae]
MITRAFLFIRTLYLNTQGTIRVYHCSSSSSTTSRGYSSTRSYRLQGLSSLSHSSPSPAIVIRKHYRAPLTPTLLHKKRENLPRQSSVASWTSIFLVAPQIMFSSLVNMELIITGLLIGVIFYAIYLCLNERLRYFENLNLPYVPGIPFFGSMASTVFHINHISETIKNIYKYNSEAKYIGVFNFMRPVIVLRDPDIIKGGPEGFLSRSLPDTGGDFEEPRALHCKSWTSKEIKEKFKLILEYGRNFVNYLSDLPEEARKTIDTKSMFEKLTNDILGICVYDITEDSFKNPINEPFVFGQKATTSGGDKTMKLFIIRSFPNLMKWFNILRLFSNRVKRFFNCIVNTMIATQDERGASRPDIISLMRDAQIKKGKNLKSQKMPEIVTYSLSRGSFDATSTQMCIIVHELAINPDIQKRLQEEIDDVLKRNKGEITCEALERMQYLDAIFKESMRLHPQFTFNGRLCTKAFELPPALDDSKPFVVQPGMSLWIPAIAINRDPKYNSDADKFIPDRSSRSAQHVYHECIFFVFSYPSFDLDAHANIASCSAGEPLRCLGLRNHDDQHRHLRLKNTESSRSDPPLLVVAKQPVAPSSTPQEIGRGSLPPSPERNIRDEQADQDSLAIEQQDEPHRPREPLPQQQQPDQLEPLQQQQQPPVQVDQINPLPLEMANQLPPALNSWEAFTQALMAHRPSLPEYNGLDHENPTSYLTKCDEYCTALQIPDEQKLSVLEKGLKGSAEKWWQCYKIYGPNIR